jgi:hypothetical protein
MHDLLQLPAGQAVFEQIGVAVQGRLEEFGLRGIPIPPGRRFLQTSIQGTHKPLMQILQISGNNCITYWAQPPCFISHQSDLRAGTGDW